LTLDVVIPTYNRADLLLLALHSLAEAACPDGLKPTVVIVDNNCRDNTADVVREFQKRGALPVLYVEERTQGRAAALNAGIRAGHGELIGMIDDDEEVDRHWFEVIFEIFSKRPVSFIGGPYIPRWGAEKPDWIVKESGGIVGWVDGGDAEKEYGPGFDGILMGGNAVIRRSALEQVGLYNTALGRTNKGLMSCEDQDIFERFLERGLKGIYVPRLRIHHHVPPERMTKAYHRRWCWGRGTSLGILARTKKQGVVEFLGIPRWQIRHAAIGFVQAMKGLVGLENPTKAFQGELRVWDLAGYIYGRYF
jgi:glycosyltransferase involved in cell wall biosynthesis